MARSRFDIWYNGLPEFVRNDILRVLRGDIPMSHEALKSKYRDYELTDWKITQMQKNYGFTHSNRDEALLKDKASGKYTDEELMTKYSLKESQFNLIIKHTRVDNGKSIELF